MEENGYITLTQAAKMAPGRPSINCLWRWARKGVLARSGQRVRLQHLRIGGKIFTTEEWVRHFGQALAEADASYFKMDDNVSAASRTSPGTRTPKQRQAAVQRAESELKDMGI